jgi:hypothetical protein
MTDRVLVLDATERPRQPLPEGAEVVDSYSRVREAARGRPTTREHKGIVWLARTGDDLALLNEIINQNIQPKGNHRLVVTDRVGRGRSEVLRALFDFVIFADSEIRLLPADELLEALSSPARDDLLIGLAIDRDDNSLVLYRGSLEPIVVPVSFFGEGAETALERGDFEVVDFGHAVRFGDREASTDAILYALDANYRRRRKAQLVRQDRSFGGALRRLRLLRGLSRDDFESVSAKEIARIERGEVKRPQSRTVALIARRLGIAPDEIGSY